MLTDEYRSLPSFPSSHFGPITVPVFVVWFQLGRPLTVTPFRVVTISKPGSLTSPQQPKAIRTSQKISQRESIMDFTNNVYCL